MERLDFNRNSKERQKKSDHSKYLAPSPNSLNFIREIDPRREDNHRKEIQDLVGIESISESSDDQNFADKEIGNQFDNVNY